MKITVRKVLNGTFAGIWGSLTLENNLEIKTLKGKGDSRYFIFHGTSETASELPMNICPVQAIDTLENITVKFFLEESDYNRMIRHLEDINERNKEIFIDASIDLKEGDKTVKWLF